MQTTTDRPILEMLEEIFKDVPESEKRTDLKEVAAFFEANRGKSLSQIVMENPEKYPQFQP